MLIGLLMGSALVAVQAPAEQATAIAAGRELTRMLFAGDLDALMPRLAPSFIQGIGGRPGLESLLRRVREQAGAEQAVLREAAYVEAGFTNYYRVARFEKMPDVTLRWVIRPDGLALGVSVQPSEQPAATTRLDYRTVAPLHLPFGAPRQDGRWYVAWGGRTPVQNYHVKAVDQRFAYDFVVTRGGAVFAGEGARNEDHFCWGEPVLAPAAGTIVEAAGDFADNERPGALREGVPPTGNHVVIDHGHGEYSLVAHFQRGSLAVRQGQRVDRGTRLGLCGNSGHSSLPHVHYHLQTGASYGVGEGLPAFFNGYRADGRAVPRGEPVRGERLLPTTRQR